jgi:hypothetical protein
MGAANIQIVHYFEHGYLEDEKSMIHSFTVTFGEQYLTGIVTSVPPYEISVLLKIIFFISVKTTAAFAVVPIDAICGRNLS